MIAPAECEDRPVKAVLPVPLEDQAAGFKSQEGEVRSATLREALHNSAEGAPTVYFAHAWRPLPMPLAKWADVTAENYIGAPGSGTSDPWRRQVPVVKLASPERAAPFVAPTWHGQRFSGAASPERISQIVRAEFRREAALTWQRQHDLAWLDIDGNGIEDAITIVSDYEAGTSCYDDVVVFLFAADGTIANADAIHDRKRRGACAFAMEPMGGDWWKFMIVPWPWSKRGLALLLEAGTGGGDGFEHYVIPLETLMSEPAASAYFVGEFVAPGGIPAEQ